MSPEEALHSFVSGLPTPAVLVREDRLLMNTAAQQLLGYAHEEVSTPEQWFATLYGETAEDIRSIYTGHRQGGRGQPVTHPVRRADGSRLWVQFSAHFTDDEEVWLLNDVTEHFETAINLDATEARWQSLVESLPGWVSEIALDGTVRWISHAPRRRQTEEIMGRQISDLIGELDLTQTQDMLADMRHTGRPLTVETQERTADGSVVWWEHRMAPLRQCGVCIGFVVYTIDATERHQQQQQCLEQERQLQQARKLEALGRMAGGVAHDFNNMLTVIQGGLDVASHELPDGHPALRELHDIQQAMNRATTLVRELLSVSRGGILQPSQVNLSSVVEGMMHLLRLELGSVELKVALASDLPEISADASRIRQVIANLVRNARDAMPDGGCVRLSTERLELKTDLVTLQGAIPAGTYAALHVRDTGLGMDKETQSHLFEPFFTTKGEGRGTGLGLSVVYGIVQQSGGHIWFETEPGKGTTFHVALPEGSARCRPEKRLHNCS